MKIVDHVKLPEKSYRFDIGLDMFIPEEFDIEPLETKTIGLGFAVSIPKNHAGILVPRSSIAAKGLIIQSSIIDPDYNGEIHLIVTNCSNHTQHVNINDRLCSLVVYKTLTIVPKITTSILSTDRNNNGLGSTNNESDHI